MAAKAIADYARVTQLLPFKGGMMGAETLDADQIRSISRLPSREVLYGQLVGVVASPVTGLVRTLGALVGGLAVALGQVREKKESGEIPAGEAPAAAGASEAAPAVEPAAQEEPAKDEEPAAQDPETPAEEAPAEETVTAEEPSGEQTPEPAAATTTDTQVEPATEPAQDDNQTEASADEQPETAEATKED